jgi:putative N6-adenine-specific DNA methylase
MNRSVEFAGDTRLMYAANLHCRLATRIIKPFKVFRANNGDRLYQNVSQVNWSRYLTPDNTFAIDAVVNHSGVTNSMFAAQKTKDAIVDQIRRKLGRRPSVELKNPDLRINLHLASNVGTLSLDSSGEALSRRGYRRDGGDAPLNEILAAGILKLTGWDGSVALVDSMCGSGTFLIEGAMMARGIAPGLNRKSFGFQRWSDFDPNLWQELVAAARAQIKPSAEIPIVGGDISTKAISMATANAKRADVLDDIEFHRSDFSKLVPPPGPGVLVINPPYGERLFVADIEALYGLIGDTLKKNFEGYDAFIFTANADAAKRIGLRTSRRIKLYNPPSECRLLKFEMYRGSRKASKQPE